MYQESSEILMCLYVLMSKLGKVRCANSCLAVGLTEGHLRCRYLDANLGTILRNGTCIDYVVNALAHPQHDACSDHPWNVR